MPALHPPRSRVCACVMMNHPFPSILPLLRKIYGSRFGAVRFLVPFERLPDPDVITVYRGSYSHAAYLSDAWPALSQIDCDYYLVIHDDVLLNPRINEANFLETFALGPNDGFIPRIQAPAPSFGNWIWNFAFLPKLLHPKSLLFGSGIEFSNLIKYLPSAATLEKAMASNGIPWTRQVDFDATMTDDLTGCPSRVLLHGLAANLPENSPRQAEVDRRSLEIERQLIQTMLDAERIKVSDEDRKLGTFVDLPIPIAAAGYFTDFYILPKSGLDDFSHYMGVAGAAGLFVEIIAPTLLSACCTNVRTATDLGLDFSGFDWDRNPERFRDPDFIAIHPIKLSTFRDKIAQDGFIALLEDIATSPIARTPRMGHGLEQGWHPSETWGAWAATHEARLRLSMVKGEPVQLTLRAPLHPDVPHLSGRFVFNEGRSTLPIEMGLPDFEARFILDEASPGEDGFVNVTLISDRLIEPSRLVPGNSDDRELGFGLVTSR